MGKRCNGERVGNIPYGFQLAEDGKHLAEEPREQALLTHIRALSAQRLSLRVIAAQLKNAGHSTRRGTPWRLESIARVLKATDQRPKLVA